jgi:hypothetical protein
VPVVLDGHQTMSEPLYHAIDEHGVVHLTWIRDEFSINTSLCSSVTSIVKVMLTALQFPTCLRCIDIASRFW